LTLNAPSLQYVRYVSLVSAPSSAPWPMHAMWRPCRSRWRS